MSPRDPFLQADFHRSAMEGLASSQNPEVRQLATALLTTMAWLDANFSDLAGLPERVSGLASNLEAANEAIKKLEIQPRTH